MNDRSQKETLDKLRETNAKFTKTVEMVKEMFNQLVANSKYSSLEDLADDIDRRYGGTLKAKELPNSQLERWVTNRTKKYQRKIVLAHKQGMVCNRCDSIVYSLDVLTEDHIIPRSNGGSGNLMNLQLLCKNCNQEKDDSDPTERDISPFCFSGQPCLHRVTCVEVGILRQGYQSNR